MQAFQRIGGGHIRQALTQDRAHTHCQGLGVGISDRLLLRTELILTAKDWGWAYQTDSYSGPSSYSLPRIGGGHIRQALTQDQAHTHCQGLGVGISDRLLLRTELILTAKDWGWAYQTGSYSGPSSYSLPRIGGGHIRQTLTQDQAHTHCQGLGVGISDRLLLRTELILTAKDWGWAYQTVSYSGPSSYSLPSYLTAAAPRDKHPNVRDGHFLTQ